MSNQRYAKAAQYEEQARMVDLLPQSWLSLTLLFVAGLLIIAGLEGLYSWMPRFAAATTDGRIAAFDLDGEGSLGACFSSFQLLLAAVLSVVVFHLRKHRLDDYHGRYRIWLWAAACWAMMAVDESGSLHEGFKELMVYLTGHRLLGDGSVWWVGAYGLVLGVIGLRVLMDMLEYPPAAVTLMLSSAVLALAVIAQLDLVLPEAGARGVMLEEGLEMLGNQLLVFALGMHVRFLIRDIKGLNPVLEEVEEEASDSDDPDSKKARSTSRRKAAAKNKPAENKSTAAQDASTSAPSKPSPKPASKPAEKPAPAAKGDSSKSNNSSANDSSKTSGSSDSGSNNPGSNQRVDGPEEPAGKGRTSKAERKAARKKKRMERRG